MAAANASGWQLALGDLGSPRPDASFSSALRESLDDNAWIEFVPGWLSGSEALFSDLLGTTHFESHDRRMYDAWVTEPRLTARWSAGDPASAPLHPVVETLRALLSSRYGVSFSSIGFALYRDGKDSVAWHGDRVGRENTDAMVAVLSLGSVRRFLIRPTGGGRSRRWVLHSGDLVVMGRCQQTWEHTVPKQAVAGPRVSLSFRHGAPEQD